MPSSINKYIIPKNNISLRYLLIPGGDNFKAPDIEIRFKAQYLP